MQRRHGKCISLLCWVPMQLIVYISVVRLVVDFTSCKSLLQAELERLADFQQPQTVSRIKKRESPLTYSSYKVYLYSYVLRYNLSIANAFSLFAEFFRCMTGWCLRSPFSQYFKIIHIIQGELYTLLLQ